MPMPAFYDTLAGFYDLEYGNRQDDISFYKSIAKKYGPPILEIGVGTGRVAIPLARSGLDVYGIDNSHQMLKIAAEKIARSNRKTRNHLHIFQADMRHFAIKKSFPVCIIPFRSFLHNLNIHDQLSTLQSINEHLDSNGVLALDLFVPIYSVINQTRWQEEIPAQELGEGEQGISLTTTVTHDPQEQLLEIENIYHRKNTQSKESIGRYCYRYIFRYEMELLLRLANFELEAVYGDFDRHPYDYYRGNMIFIARKK